MMIFFKHLFTIRMILIYVFILIQGLLSIRVYNVNKFQIEDSKRNVAEYIEDISNVAETRGYEVSKTRMFADEELPEGYSKIGRYKIMINKSDYIAIRINNYKGTEEFDVMYINKMKDVRGEFDYALYSDICNCISGRKIRAEYIENIINDFNNQAPALDKDKEMLKNLTFDESWTFSYYYDCDLKEEMIQIFGLSKKAVPKKYKGNYWVFMW